jgi:hypothetical protein
MLHGRKLTGLSLTRATDERPDDDRHCRQPAIHC